MDIKELKKLISSGKKTIKDVAGENYGVISKAAEVATYKDLSTVKDSVLKKVCEAINKVKK